MICLPVHLAIQMPILLPIHLPILLAVNLSIILPILLPVGLAIHLPILLSIGLPIFLTDVGLRHHHSRHDGWGCHGHNQAGNRYCFQHAALHDSSSLNVREWVMSVSRGSRWTVPIRLSHLVARSN